MAWHGLLFLGLVGLTEAYLADDAAEDLDADVAAMSASMDKISSMDVRLMDKGYKPELEENRTAIKFVNIPSNFGHHVAFSGMRLPRNPLKRMIKDDMTRHILKSFWTTNLEEQWKEVREGAGAGGEIWGNLIPAHRTLSPTTGCSWANTPPKYWPEDVAGDYFDGSEAFGLLRDPYDRIVYEFRQRAGDWKSFDKVSKEDIAIREELKDADYQEDLKLEDTCDLNRWVLKQMTKYINGERFRHNCAFLPQSEYFDAPHGITKPIDVRKLPDSFNDYMQETGRGTMLIGMEGPLQSIGKCQVSPFDLSEESRRLIQYVYSQDFELICDSFGYCNQDERTCLGRYAGMCPGAAARKYAKQARAQASARKSF